VRCETPSEAIARQHNSVTFSLASNWSRWPDDNTAEEMRSDPCAVRTYVGYHVVGSQ